ncbi:Nramp family divalent metal transporter [Olsenella porci]|nr:Nramp family divalent metal transporter [Olsenella porci]
MTMTNVSNGTTDSEQARDTLPQRLRRRFGGMRTGGHGGLEILRSIGPGLLVTVGFIDPGNWASNMAAGSQFGYSLLWVVTLSTIMLIMLQHNAAHLGIATGQCLAEATTTHLPRPVSRLILASAYLATVATALAEVLGGAIALQMLFGLPLPVGSVLVAAASLSLLMSSSYKRVERWIIAFVSLIGISFLVELALVDVSWGEAAVSWVTPALPSGSLAIVMSVLGAVVMPHNLFLHSEVIQSQHFEARGDDVVRERLRNEFVDTLFSMGVGWAINSAMVILAATTFFARGIVVDDLAVAAQTLSPILGQAATVTFALALLLAGLSSSITAAMAAGTISAGMFGEEYDIHDRHSSVGVVACMAAAALACLLVPNAFQGLVVSQALLSLQLPITVFLQVYLTSSRRVMGRWRNSTATKVVLVAIGVTVTFIDVIGLLG